MCQLSPKHLFFLQVFFLSLKSLAHLKYVVSRCLKSHPYISISDSSFQRRRSHLKILLVPTEARSNFLKAFNISLKWYFTQKSVFWNTHSLKAWQVAVKSFISVTENRDRGQSGIAMVTMEASHDTITTKHNQAVPGILPISTPTVFWMKTF